MKILKLINNETNTLYTMEQVDDTMFKSTWGPIGDTDTISTLNYMDTWDKLIATKKSIGFTELVPEEDIPNLNIAERIAELQRRILKEKNL